MESEERGGERNVPLSTLHSKSLPAKETDRDREEMRFGEGAESNL